MAGRMVTSEERRRERRWKRIREGVGRFFRRVAMGAALAVAGPMASYTQPPRSAQPSQHAVQTQESRGQNRSGQGADGEYSVRIYTPEENVRRLMERGLIREARQDRVLFARLYGIGGEELVRQLSRDMFLRGVAAYGRFRGPVVMGEEDLKAMLKRAVYAIWWRAVPLSASQRRGTIQEAPFYTDSRIIHLARASCGNTLIVNCIHATNHYPYFEEVLNYQNACLTSLIPPFQCNEATLTLEFWEKRDTSTIFAWREDKKEENAQIIAKWLKKELVEKIAEGRLEESRVDIRGLITDIENNDIIWGGNWTYYPNKKTFLPHLEVRIGRRKEGVFIERRVWKEGMILANARNRYYFTGLELTSRGVVLRAYVGRYAPQQEVEEETRRNYNFNMIREVILSNEFSMGLFSRMSPSLIRLPSHQQIIFTQTDFSEILRENPLGLLGEANESLGDLLKRLVESGKINIIEREGRRIRLYEQSTEEHYSRIRQMIRINEDQGRTGREILENLLDYGNYNIIRIGKWRGNEFIVYARPRQINGLFPTYDLVPEFHRVEVRTGPLRRKSRRLIEKREIGNVVFIDRMFSPPEIANKMPRPSRFMSEAGEVYIAFDGGGCWSRGETGINLLEIPRISLVGVSRRFVGERIRRNRMRIVQVTYTIKILRRYSDENIFYRDNPIRRIIINGQPLSKKERYDGGLAAVTIYQNQFMTINGAWFHQIEEESVKEAIEFARRRYGELDWNRAEVIGWTPRVITFEEAPLGIVNVSNKALVFVLLPKKNGQLVRERFEDGERVFGIMIEVPLRVYIGGRWYIWRRTIRARPAYVKIDGEVDFRTLTSQCFDFGRGITSEYNIHVRNNQIERIMQLRRQMMDQLRQRRLARR